MRKIFYFSILLCCLSACISNNENKTTKIKFSTTIGEIPSSWYIPFWTFDPSNISGCANDSNNCTSTSCNSSNRNGPCSSLQQIINRLGTTDPVFQQSTTILMMSDDSPNWNNPIRIHPRVDYPNIFTFQGSQIQLGTATIGTYTPLNRAAGTRGTITALGQTGNYWSQYVTEFIHDTTNSANFWIDADLGSATAAISTPLQPYSSSVLIPPYVTIAANDSITISRPVKAWCAEIGTKRYNIVAQRILNIDCEGPSSLSDVSIGLFESKIGDNTIISPCSTDLPGFYINNMLGSSASEPFSSILALQGQWVGGIIKTADNQFGCPSNKEQVIIDGDILIKQRQHLANGAILTIGRAYFGGGNALHTYSSFEKVQIGSWGPPGIYYADAEMWGPSSLELDDGEQLICEQNCTSQILLTGGLIMGSGSGQATFTTAFGWNNTSASWTNPATTITPAAIDSAGAMCRPEYGTCFFSRQVP